MHTPLHHRQNDDEFHFLSPTGDTSTLAQGERLRKLLQRVAEDASEAIIVTEARLDPPGPKILWVNSAFTEITGYEKEEAVGKTPRMLQGPDTEETVLRRLRARLAAGERFEGETVNYRKDGTPFVNHWSIAPLYGPDDQIHYWVSVQRDVTEKRRLSKAVVRALDEERRRIGRDLHDSVGSDIIGAAMQLDNVANRDDLDPSVADRLHTLRASIVRGYTNLRRLSQGLSPVDLSEGSLSDALAKLASNTPHCRFECEIDLDAALSSLDVDTRANLYWIVREATANAHRHGEASRIRIHVARNGPALQFTVSDDGRGFVPSAVRENAWGLKIMQYRADLVGADLRIESQKGEGTRVTCQVFP